MSKTKRISLITLLVTLILSMLAFAVVNMGHRLVMADTTAPFAFEDGASVKIIEDGGMRFRLQMDENTADEIKESSDDLVFYVVPEKYYVENMTVSDLENLLYENCGSNKAQKVVADKEKIYNGVTANGDSACFSNCLLDINLSKYNGAYNTVNFIVFASWNGNLVKSEIRNLRDVASSAALDAYYSDVTSIYTWLGSEQYAISVDTLAEYQALQAKVSAGLETDLHFNIYNKFTTLAGGKIENRENLPKNTTFYHYVSYYDEDTTTLIDKVEVKEGETAEITKTAPKAGDQILDYANSVVYEYYVNAWVNVANTQSTADLSNITENKRVFAYYGKKRVDQTLYAEACAANPDVALFFSENFGFTQLSAGGSGHTFHQANREYHPDMSYGGIQGMTSYTVYNTSGQDARMIFKIKINENFTYNAGDYVKFYVYSDHTTPNTTDARTLVRCNNQNGVATVCDNKDWSEIVFPVEEFVKTDSDGNTFLSFGCFPGGSTITIYDVYKYYISNVVRVPASEVKRIDDCATDGCTHTDATIASDNTYTVGAGDVELIGPIYRHHWGSNHGNIGEVDKHVYCIEGKIIYGNLTNPTNAWPARAIGLNFANKMSGKIYFTAKGFETGAGVRTFANGQEDGANAWKTFTRVTELDSNGFAVYECNLGETGVAYVRLCGYTEAYGQVIISNISTYNPAA